MNKNYFDSNSNLKQSGLDGMRREFLSDLKEVNVLNSKLTKPFASDAAATYHCKKHGILDNLTTVEYMEKIQNCLNNATETTVSLSQEGNATIVSYIFREEGSNISKQVLVIINPQNKEYTMTMFDVRK